MANFVYMKSDMLECWIY